MYTVGIVVGIAVGLIINAILASNASDIAEEKGYPRRRWFHMCFWLGPISYIIVAGMPDKTLRQRQLEANKLLAQILEGQGGVGQRQQQDVVSSFLQEL